MRTEALMPVRYAKASLPNQEQAMEVLLSESGRETVC